MRHSAEKVLAIVVGVVVLLAIGAGVVSAGRGTPQLAVGSPQSTVQTYLAGVFERDLPRAAEVLDPAGACGLTDLQRIAPQSITRAVLRGTTISEDRARVRVDLVYEKSGGRFGGSWIEPLTFRLTDTGDGWVITGSPWPMFECGTGPLP